jgi:signal transduction histidine kinase
MMAQQPEQLHARLASQSELIGSLTHDIKGLLTSLEGGVYMIDSGIQKSKQERIEQGLSMLRRNLSRLRRTVGSVQYYVKDRELVPEPLELREVTTALQTALAEHAAQLDVPLVIEAAQGAFEGDDFALHSLLVNLLDYALACSTSARGAKGVALAATRDGGDVIFTVSTRGARVPPEVLEQLRSGRYAPLLGDRAHLGLFIANKLAGQLGGALQTTTELEATRFVVRLPAAPELTGRESP